MAEQPVVGERGIADLTHQLRPHPHVFPRLRIGPDAWSLLDGAGIESPPRLGEGAVGETGPGAADVDEPTVLNIGQVQRAEPEEVHLPQTGRGYVHEAEEVHRCLAEGLLESPVMPLADTLEVQWVLEEALGQLGVTMAEAPVEL